MQYLLLIYNNEKTFQNVRQEEGEKIMSDYMAFTQSIVKSGHFKAGDGLQPTNTATTVRAGGTTDGPFAETKEQLGGYYLVDAQNLDEAISIAKRIPVIKHGGCVEVRPVMDTPKP
jgi:hypothetical protein